MWERSGQGEPSLVEQHPKASLAVVVVVVWIGLRHKDADRRE
jgi:hypothetical protein